MYSSRLKSSLTWLLTALLLFAGGMGNANAQDYTTGILLRVKGSDVSGVSDGAAISTITPTTGAAITQSQSGVQPVFVASDSHFQNHAAIRIATGKGMVTSLTDSTGSYSVAMAFYAAASSNLQFAFDAGASTRWLVGTSSSSANLSSFDGGFHDSGSALPTGAHIIVWTLDATANKTFIYVDGTRVDSGSLTWASRALGNPVAVFSNNDAPSNPQGSLQGDVAELRVYAGVLTSGQVANVNTALSTLYISGPTQRQLVCIGDSQTYGYLVGGGQISTPYPAALGTLLGSGWVVINQGYSGYDLDRIFNYNPVPGAGNSIQTGGYPISSPRASILALPSSSYIETDGILVEGTNSAYHSVNTFGYSPTSPETLTGQTDADIIARYKQAITDLKNAGYTSVWLATTISSKTPSASSAFETRIDHVGALIRSSWSAMGATGYIDWRADPRFYGQNATNNSLFYQGDGVHETVPGAGFMAQDCLPVISLYGTSYSVATTPIPFSSSSSGTKRRLQ